MAKLTDEIFNESCCDGGAASANSKSCQPCGCDEGANWVCSFHKVVAMVQKGYDKAAELQDEGLFKDEG